MAKKLLATIVLLTATASPLLAATSIQRLSKNRFLITHQKETTFGGGGTMRIATTKAATACLVLHYTHYAIGATESEPTVYQFRRGSGTVEARFSLGDDDEAIECEPAANRKKYWSEVAVGLNKGVPNWRKIAAENKASRHE